MADTKSVNVTLKTEKYAALKQQAEQKGVPLPTYCRMLLSEFAEVPKQVAA